MTRTVEALSVFSLPASAAYVCLRTTYAIAGGGIMITRIQSKDVPFFPTRVTRLMFGLLKCQCPSDCLASNPNQCFQDYAIVPRVHPAHVIEQDCQSPARRISPHLICKHRAEVLWA